MVSSLHMDDKLGTENLPPVERLERISAVRLRNRESGLELRETAGAEPAVSQPNP